MTTPAPAGSVAYHLLTLAQNGSGGEFIVTHPDAARIIDWLERGIPFRCWVNRAGSAPRSSGLIVVPRQGGLSCTMRPITQVPIDAGGNPIPPGAPVQPASVADPGQFTSVVTALSWDDGIGPAPAPAPPFVASPTPT